MGRLEVKADNLQFILVIFLGLLLLPFGLFNVIGLADPGESQQLP